MAFTRNPGEKMVITVGDGDSEVEIEVSVIAIDETSVILDFKSRRGIKVRRGEMPRGMDTPIPAEL